MAGSAIIGALQVVLTMDTAAFQKGVTNAQKQAGDLGKKLEGFGTSVTNVGTKMAAGITLPFAALLSTAIPAAIETRNAMGQVEAALKSMGSASGRTAEQLKAQAEALQGMSTFDDDDILTKVTANLLTFGNVSKDVFDRAQKSIVDISARMGTDLQGAALMVGKALNDPAKGLAALRRVGIQFTEQQSDQIKKMAAAGDAAGAQRIMLAELERQFSGSAQAMQDANPADALKDSWANFNETVGEAALKVLPPLTNALKGFLDAFNNLSPGMQSVAIGGAAVAAALGPIMMGLGPVIGLVGKLVPLLVTTAPAATAAGTAAAGAAGGMAGLTAVLGPLALAAGAVYLAWKNWDTIGPILSNWAGGVKKNFQDAQADLDSFQGKVREVDKALGIPPPSAFFDGIGPALKGFVADWDKGADSVMEDVRAFDSAFAAGAVSVAKSLWDMAGKGDAYLSRLGESARKHLIGGLASVWSSIKEKAQAAGDHFRNLWDRVVGHSYIPDMVDGIAEHIARLDREMVEPVKKSTKGASDAMKKMADEQYKTAKASFDSLKGMSQEMSGLLARLFPQETAAATFAKELDFIEKNAAKLGLGADQAAEAVRRLRAEYAKGLPEDPKGAAFTAAQGTANGILDRLNPGNARQRQFIEDSAALEKMKGFGYSAQFVQGELAKLRAEYDTWLKEQDKGAERTKVSTAQMVESFASLTRDVTGSLSNLVSQVKKGDWLSALSSVVDIIGQVAGMFGQGGVFGKKTATPTFNRAPSVPGFAQGGSFTVGGRAGVDKNLIQFAATKGERVDITPGRRQGGGGAGGGAYFDLRGAVMTEDLLRQMNAMADGAAMRGAAGGAAMVQESMARSSRRSLR